MSEKSKLDPDIKANLAAWFRYFRSQRGETQGEFARHIGTSQPAIHKAERGDVGLVVLVMLSKSFSEKIDTMINFKPPELRKAPPSEASQGAATLGRRKESKAGG